MCTWKPPRSTREFFHVFFFLLHRRFFRRRQTPTSSSTQSSKLWRISASKLTLLTHRDTRMIQKRLESLGIYCTKYNMPDVAIYSEEDRAGRTGATERIDPFEDQFRMYVQLAVCATVKNWTKEAKQNGTSKSNIASAGDRREGPPHLVELAQGRVRGARVHFR